MSNRFFSIYNKYRQDLRFLDIESNLIELNKSFWNKGIGSVILTNDEEKLLIDHRQVIKPNFYITYLEKQANFSKSPVYDIGMNPNEDYVLNFYGELEGNVSVNLFLVYYKNGEKNQVEVIELNKTTIIERKPGVEQIRLAIRVAGKGITLIQQLQLIELNKIRQSILKQYNII